MLVRGELTVYGPGIPPAVELAVDVPAETDEVNTSPEAMANG